MTRLCALFTLALCACAGGEKGRPWPADLPENPEDGYHFDGESEPYYEAWYHKVALPEQDESFFFIYGLINPKPDTAYPREVFLYCARGTTRAVAHRSFSLQEFRASRKLRDVRLGEDARTTALRYAGEIGEGGHRCRWDIDLSNSVAWTGTMGWMTGAEGMETSWTVGNFTAAASGFVEFDGDTFRFEGAPAYCDHNWGSKFPRQWYWIQANRFDAGVAVAASGGTVMAKDAETEAHMVGLLRDGEMLTFRTMDLDVVNAQFEMGAWSLASERDLSRIALQAHCDPADLIYMPVPTEGGMQPYAYESLLGTMEVTLEERATKNDPWEVTFQGTSDYAGVELGK
jgi:tocopherol cyclase